MRVDERMILLKPFAKSVIKKLVEDHLHTGEFVNVHDAIADLVYKHMPGAIAMHRKMIRLEIESLLGVEHG